MCHSWGKHGAQVEAFYTEGKRQAEAGSNDDEHVAHPGERVKLVVLVMLP